MKTLIAVLVCLLFCLPLAAQDAANLYAAGISSNPAAHAHIGGFGMYAHQLSGGTYAVSLLGIAPISVRPFTVSTQVSEGVAQKVLTVKNLPIYALAAAGGAFQGTNSGFAWTGGGAAVAKVKGHKLLIGIRFTKSAVSNGAGYQINPAVGYVF